MPKFKVVVGCNYPPEDTRSEPGDVIEVDDKVGKALLSLGAVEPYKAEPATKPSQASKTASQNIDTPDGSSSPETGKEG